MIDLWKYVDNAGNTFIGMAQEVTDEEDRSDEERKEMGITIECDGALIEFYQSDIKSIEKCGEGA